MKRGELSRAAERLGISRQALWARNQRALGKCTQCGRKVDVKGKRCKICKRKMNVYQREKYRKAHPNSIRRPWA